MVMKNKCFLERVIDMSINFNAVIKKTNIINPKSNLKFVHCNNIMPCNNKI